jgi:AraC-like DNA-binding protein
MSHDTPKPFHRWSTDEVPRAKRLEYFAGALSEAVYPLGVDQVDAETFHADVTSAQFGGVSVCKTVGAAHCSFRGRTELARTNAHTFNLLMLTDRPWAADHRGHLDLSQRDVLIVDSQRPLKTDIRAPFTAIAVSGSEAWLRQWIPDPHVLASRRIKGSSLWGLALSSYLNELSPELAANPPLPLSVMADQVGSLLALTAEALQNASVASTPAVRSLHERIRDHMAHRCTEVELTAADVAAALSISVRTLHRAFAAANQTFGGCLIDARARVAIRMLASPLFKRVTTAEIGRRAGFLSASHFARVIHHRTGRTPLQLRRGVHSDALDGEALVDAKSDRL